MPVEALALLGLWCLVIAALALIGARRSREFERALAAAGFATSNSTSLSPDIFRRRDAVISRVVTGVVHGVRTTFVFGSCPGTPQPLEGTLVIPSIAIAAVLVDAPTTRAWLGAWSDHRAYGFGWRPTYAADVTRDGRILLAWDHFGESRSQFESCCSALARSWAAPK